MTLKPLTQLTEMGAGLKVKMMTYKEVCDLLVSALRNLQSREHSTFLGYSSQEEASELDRKECRIWISRKIEGDIRPK